MKIALFSSSYFPVLGGLQTVTHTLAKHFLQRGDEVEIVTNRYPVSLPEHENLEGVKISRYLFLKPGWHYLLRGRIDLFLAAFFVYPSTLWKIDWFMKNFQPDVVNLHFPDNQIPFILRLKQRYKFRLIVSLHGHEVERFFEGVKKSERDLKLLRQILQAADIVTACSRYLLNKAEELAPLIRGKGKVIHNGIDFERFREKKEHPHSKPYLLAYGRFTWKKGFDLLLEAFAKITEKHPELDLLLAGDGEERESLQAKAKSLGLKAKVRFYGRATPEQIVQLLNGCEFLVMPSRFETFGIVALEGMAAGKAVLATRVGGLPEFMAASSFMECSAEDMSRHLHDWLSRRDFIQEAGKCNLRRAQEFSSQKMIEQYRETYDAK